MQAEFYPNGLDFLSIIGVFNVKRKSQMKLKKPLFVTIVLMLVACYCVNGEAGSVLWAGSGYLCQDFVEPLFGLFAFGSEVGQVGRVEEILESADDGGW